MANFTPVSAAIGGGLIGLSAVLLMLLTGRVAGISGIFGGLLDLGNGDKGWRIASMRRLWRSEPLCSVTWRAFAPHASKNAGATAT